jgi:hypothetical protein
MDFGGARQGISTPLVNQRVLTLEIRRRESSAVAEAARHDGVLPPNVSVTARQWMQPLRRSLRWGKGNENAIQRELVRCELTDFKGPLND